MAHGHGGIGGSAESPRTLLAIQIDEGPHASAYFQRGRKP